MRFYGASTNVAAQPILYGQFWIRLYLSRSFSIFLHPASIRGLKLDSRFASIASSPNLLHLQEIFVHCSKLFDTESSTIPLTSIMRRGAEDVFFLVCGVEWKQEIEVEVLNVACGIDV
eukprot:scaffold32514_cov57-Cyclotella_meneghiniana.AAC.5